MAASQGREGGYLCVDWNGAVMPRVFMPYSPVNANEVFAAGGTIEDICAAHFLAGTRQWQRDYGFPPTEEHHPRQLADALPDL